MTPAIDMLRGSGVEFTAHEYAHGSACTDFGKEAAEKLGVDPARMFKTIVVKGNDGKLAMALVSVRDRIDLKKLAEALRCKKAELADPLAAEKATGYVIGGISPLGGRKRLPMLIDESISHFDKVYVSGGRRGLQLELGVGNLLELTGAKIEEIAHEGNG